MEASPVDMNTDRHRGLFICLENIIPNDFKDINKLEKEIQGAIQGPSKASSLKVMKVPDLQNSVQERIKMINNESVKMGKRARHMVNAMERWKIREEILKNIENGISVILLNFCFKDIAEIVDDETNIQWAKTQYTGYIRPDLVLYADTEEEVISKYFKDFKYMENINEKLDAKVRTKQSTKELRIIPKSVDDPFEITNIINHINRKLIIYENSNEGDFETNFYPNSIGEDLFMYKEY